MLPMMMRTFGGPLRDIIGHPGLPLGDNIENFTKAFCEVLGYEVCSDGELEPGYLKLAIYAIGNDTKHMARQLSDGSWTSKLGVERDITHTLAAVEGQHYGNVVQFLKRKN